MRRRHVLMLMGSAAVAPSAALSAPPQTVANPIDWPSFLRRHDLIWDRVPTSWDEAPFLGNGLVASMIYVDPATGALRIDLGRSDVQDHRFPNRTQHDRVRLPIGHFLLKPRGAILPGCRLRLGLHDATLRGEIQTDRGRIGLTAYVHAEAMVMVVEMTASAGEAGVTWEWVGEEALSPRQTWGLTHNEPSRVDKTYQPNPPGQRRREGQDELWIQPLMAGGGTVTAWRSSASGLVVSVQHAYPGAPPVQAALDAVRAAVGDTQRVASHQAWWDGFYRASFVSLSDTRIESFYWIQLYKLASATRQDRSYVDNQGPWLQPTAWPWATWNLNVQLIYWPAIASNHCELVGSLIRAIHDNQANLIANVAPEFRHDSATLGRSAGSSLDSPATPPPPEDVKPQIMSGMTAGASRYPEMGNLPWALHDVWLVWRHTMDERLLRETLFPVLRRTTNYYRHFLKRGADGRLHLPPTYSPEFAAAQDLNYDLALLHWSCAALIDAATRLGIDDPLLGEWRMILTDLVDFPTSPDQGFMIGAGQPLDRSHRHYSHLLMIYPLYLINRDQPGAEALIAKSLQHWQSMPEALRGYSSTGAASISAALGQGDRALSYLDGLFDDYLRPNTFYKESGPVIETPLSGAQSILDMLLQSWGGVLRPFPAMPSRWADAVFEDLSAEGGFSVSASWRGRKVEWITVKSRAGEPLIVSSDIADPVATVDGQPRALTRVAEGRYAATLAKGETLVIHPRTQRPDLRVRPIKAGLINSFGLNRRNPTKVQRDMSLIPPAPA